LYVQVEDGLVLTCEGIAKRPLLHHPVLHFDGIGVLLLRGDVQHFCLFLLLDEDKLVSYLIVEDGIGHCAEGEADDEGDQRQHEREAEDFGHFFSRH
jgi:hypothetical protein